MHYKKQMKKQNKSSNKDSTVNASTSLDKCSFVGTRNGREMIERYIIAQSLVLV